MAGILLKQQRPVVMGPCSRAQLRTRQGRRNVETVIASQRVGAKRRPMTGEAKQSMEQQESKSGLLRRSAPRNDVQM